MIDTKAGANDGRPPIFGRRPGEGDARIEIGIIRRTEARAYAAVPLRPAGGEIKRIPAALYFMKNTEIAVTQAQIQREIWSPLELVLNIAVRLRFAQTVDGIFARETG